MLNLSYCRAQESFENPLVVAEFPPASSDMASKRASVCLRLAAVLKKHFEEPEIIKRDSLDCHIDKARPNLIVPIPSAFQGGALLAKLGSAFTDRNGINIIFSHPGDLIHVREGNLNLCYVRYGAIITSDHTIVHGSFSGELVADKVVHCAKDDHAKKKLYRSGVCLLNDPAISVLCRSKDLTHEFLERHGVSVPASLVIQTSDGFREATKRFLETLRYTNEVIVKPIRGSQGYGIKFFNKNCIEDICQYVERLSGEGHSVILQERIDPFILVGDRGQRMDWNLRVISFGSQKPIICNIRSDDYDKYAPVNKSLGSKTEVFSEELFTGYAVHSQNASAQYRAILTNIENLLQIVDPELRDSGLIGYDVIVRQDLSVVVIELNGDATGGIGTALECLRDEPLSQKALASKIIDALQDNLRHSALVRGNSCPTNIRVSVPLV